jgi:signal transduction histidine kinase
VAVLVVAFITLVTGKIEVSDGERAIDAFAYGAIAAAGGALALRRRQPLVTVAAVTAALSLYVTRNYAGGPIFVTELVALYSLAVSTNRRRALAVAAMATLVLVGAGAVTGLGGGLIHLLFAAWATTAVLLGDAVRSRREHLATLEERARYLERTREEEARRRVVEERLRIARDLHDSVAHSMATINVQAGAAEHVLERHPEQARQALTAIRNASGDVLDELAAMLGLLRVDAGEAQPRSPTPSLDQLDALLESTRNAGIEVQLHGNPGQPGVSKTVSGAAYRIVQESLTNVLRHAGATRVSVRISAPNGADDGNGDLVLEITDDGRGGNGDVRGAGVGIVGMRERAEATGGQLEAGTRPEGGFAVRATWPARE